MDYLWDTNILLHQIRQFPQFEKWDQDFEHLKGVLLNIKRL